MQFEDERIDEEKELIKAERELCQQKIKAAERYERLLSNRDFQDMLKDLEITVKVHKSQLDVLDMDIEQANSPFKLMRVAMVRKIHLERMRQIQEAINRPAALVEIGKSARERLDALAQKEKEIINAS